MASSGHFRLSITRALGDQLAEEITKLTPDRLDQFHLQMLEDRPGVYQLYEDGVLVYVGKADKSLATRLGKHHAKIAGRLNLGVVGFTCLYVDEDLHAVAPERLLIVRYKDQGLASWNFNGFGNNDPGRNRDETLFEESHFDSKHPANLNVHCVNISPGHYRVDELLKRVKAGLPYVFRYQSAAFHKHIEVEVDESDPTADHLFTLIGRAISEVDQKWRIAALPGYVVMYAKHGPYPSARKFYPSLPSE